MKRYDDPLLKKSGEGSGSHDLPPAYQLPGTDYISQSIKGLDDNQLKGIQKLITGQLEEQNRRERLKLEHQNRALKLQADEALKATIKRQTGQDINPDEFGGNYDQHALWNTYGKAGQTPQIAFNQEVFWQYVTPYEYNHRKEITATHMIGAFIAVSILALAIYGSHEQATIAQDLHGDSASSDHAAYKSAQAALHIFTSSLGAVLLAGAAIWAIIKAYDRNKVEATDSSNVDNEMGIKYDKYGSKTDKQAVRLKNGSEANKSIYEINSEAAVNHGNWGLALTTFGMLISTGFIYAATYAKSTGDLGVAAMLSAPIGALCLIMGAQQYEHRAQCEKEGMKNKVYKKESEGSLESIFAGAVALLAMGIIFYGTDGLHVDSTSPNAADNVNNTLLMVSRLSSALFVLGGIVGGLIAGNKAAVAADKKYNEAPAGNKPTLNTSKVNHNLTILWALAGLAAGFGSLALHLISGASVSDRMGGAGLAAVAGLFFARAGLNAAKSANNKWEGPKVAHV